MSSSSRIPKKGGTSSSSSSSVAHDMAGKIFVMDNGGGRIKYGSASHTEPQGGVINSIAKLDKQMSLLIGDQVEEVQNGSLLHYTRPFERGYLTNPAVEIEIWDRLFHKELKSSPGNWGSQEHDYGGESLILTDAPFTPVSLQNDMNEVIFEHYGFGEYLRRPAAWFSGYMFEQEVQRGDRKAVHSSCCTVVDSGFSFTHIFPFVDGKCVKNGVKRVNVGGKLLTNYLKEVVSYRQWNMMDEFKLMDQVKEDLCFVSTDFQNDLRTASLARGKKRDDAHGSPKDYLGGKMRKSFALPDFSQIMKGFVKEDDAEIEQGEQVLGMDIERFCVPEVLFHPSDVGMDQAGITEATWQALQQLNQAEMGLASSNMLLTGGNMRLPQIEERFKNEVRQHIPDIFHMESYLPRDPDTYAWRGAAAFARHETELGTINQHMVTRAEFLERGHGHVNEKFFRGW
jgi:actin-related protein 6